MKIRRIIPKRKLRATAAARRVPQRASEDFGQEPSVSFGKALIVFIVLHIVAVSGIYIFNSLKARNIEQSSAPATHVVKQQATPAPASADAQEVHEVKRVVGKQGVATAPGYEVAGKTGTASIPIPAGAKAPAKTLPKPAAAAATPAETVHRKIAGEPVAKPAPRPAVKPQAKDADAAARDSGQVYAVLKGETLVSIAKKFHVTTASLLKLNNIDDPKKLRIGQKLHIPPKAKKPATTFNFHSVRVC